MSSIFEYPELVKPVVVETGMMKAAIRRMLAVHHLGGLCVWSGRAGMGKTTTAEYMVQLTEEAYDSDNPRAFRAMHYIAGSKKITMSEAKHGIRSLYYGVGCSLDEGVYRTHLPEELAADLVHFLKKMNIQIVFVDEAGCLSLDAIRGIVLVSDTARLMGLTLTIVLIGMDNLPAKVTRIPQIDRRIHEWCYFKPCTLEETYKFLAALHPYFAGLNPIDASHKEQISYIHEACKGMPGSLVPFVSRFGSMFGEVLDEDPMVHIQAALIQPLFDKKRCEDDSRSNYSGKMEEPLEAPDASMPPDEGKEDDQAGESANVIEFPTKQKGVEVEDGD
jgi:AAA domain